MSFRAPVSDIMFSLRHVAGLDALASDGIYPELTPDLADSIIAEAGRFATERIAPLNRDGDRIGARLVDGSVETAPGWRDIYRDWAAGGWSALSASPEFGGQGLPVLMNAACLELWNSASMAFGIGPVLTMGAVEALSAHGSADLRATYLPKLVAGEWTGTMNLTEPQAGSDLGALKTRAARQGDGTYRIRGQKIFITYGEHDLTENIVHFVLARLPDAPQGTRGISLFLVPKYIPGADGSLAQRNDLFCSGLEHKLGIHGSPTCTMVFGDTDGAVGWLVGEENKGLACMFTMMNNARLAVGLQGVAIAERAYQQALGFARERRQGKAPGWSGDGMSPIILHPDVRRMLLEMRSKTVAARGICYQAAEAIDRAHHGRDEASRRRAHDRASLLTPVAKAFSTDIGIEVASLGVQVHGGMGFIEETGAAQHLRDARIAAIYEGTNGIQAIDLAMRKVPLDEGRAVKSFIAELRASIEAIEISNAGLSALCLRLGRAVADLERATTYVQDAATKRPEDALAGATLYLRLFGVTAGGVALAREAAAAAAGGADATARLRIDTAGFFASQVVSGSGGLADAVMEGVDALGTPLPAEA